jgi:hypothetical protein
MRTRLNVLFLLVALGCLCIAGTPVAADSSNGTHAALVTNNPQNTGTIGPDNPLYGFKIALENFDESFTFNQSERLEKEINHTDLRLSELQSALADNNTEAINRTLDLYWQKYNQTENTLDQLAFNDTFNMTAPNGTIRMQSPRGVNGLENALNNLYRHQEIFQNLTQKYPDNQGLARAYNNSLEREHKFEEKIQERSRFGQDNPAETTDNSTFVPLDRHDTRTLNQTGNGTMTAPQGDIRQSGRLGNSTFQQGTNQSWQQPGGAGTGTTHNPTNQTSQDQGKRVNPETQGGPGQSTDHQVNGNGNSNAVQTQETRGNSGVDNSQGDGKGNGSNNGNTRQSTR